MKRDGIIYKSFTINLSGSEDLPSGKNLIHKKTPQRISPLGDFFSPPTKGNLKK
jgi:hypothetical protein